MKTYKLNAWGNEYNIALKKTEYTNGRTAIIMNVVEDNKIVEQWGVLTVNLPDEPLLGENFAYVDTNNNGQDIIGWLEENNIAHTTGFYGFSGFCSYPMVEFEEEI